MRLIPTTGFAVCAVAAAISGCFINAPHSNPSGPAAGAVLASATIGSQGGTLSVTAAESATLAGTSITIPAGALTAPVAITISASSSAVAQGGDTAAGPVADFEPSGTTFLSAATITLPVTDASAGDVAIQAVEASGSTLLLPLSSVSASGIATFGVMGFTRYGGVHHHRDGGPAEDGGPEGTQCTTNSDCGDDDDCINGYCEPCCEVLDAGEPDSGVVNCMSNYDCASGSYCDTTSCGASGTCTAMPQDCPQDCISPELCGCDGQMYCNSCLAAAAGTGVGSCGTAGDAGPAQCQTDSDCPQCDECVNGQCFVTDQICAIDAGPAPSDGGVVCGCPAQPSDGCFVTGPGPCFCQQEVACDGGSSAEYYWYNTCGGPVCLESPDAGPLTSSDGGVCPAPGTPCSTPNATCGQANQGFCGVTEVCSQTDPSAGPCPI